MYCWCFFAFLPAAFFAIAKNKNPKPTPFAERKRKKSTLQITKSNNIFLIIFKHIQKLQTLQAKQTCWGKRKKSTLQITKSNNIFLIIFKHIQKLQTLRAKQTCWGKRKKRVCFWMNVTILGVLRCF